MKLLKHDIDAIARIVDRCAAGGADNRNGVRFAIAKANHQFELQFSDYNITSKEYDDLVAEFGRQVSELWALDQANDLDKTNIKIELAELTAYIATLAMRQGVKVTYDTLQAMARRMLAADALLAAAEAVMKTHGKQTTMTHGWNSDCPDVAAHTAKHCPGHIIFDKSIEGLRASIRKAKGEA